MHTRIFEKEEETGFYKIASSPNYVLSDFHITTRRIKTQQSEDFPDLVSWASIDFDPFGDSFKEDIWESDPI